MPGAMPSAIDREAAGAAPSSAAPPSRSFFRSLYARCVGEEQEEQQAAAAGGAYSCGQPAAGDSREMQQLRMQLAQMQAQLAAQQVASAVVPPPPQDTAAVVVTENPFRFSKAELLKLSMTCDPAVLKNEMTLAMARLKTRSSAAYQLLNFTSDEFEAAMSSSADWRNINSLLATFFVSVIDNEKPHGRNFYKKAAKQPEILESGYSIGCYLISTTEPKTGKELEECVLRIQNEQYFQMGMTQLQTEEAAEQLRRDWAQTVAGRAGIANDSLRVLVKKFPASVKAEAEKYESEINESEILGQTLRWDFDQMTDILAVLLRRKPDLGPTAPTPFDSNAVDAAKNKWSGPCPCCGKNGHGPLECPTKCSKCGEKSCPGNYGGVCVVCCDEPVPAVVNNATRTKPIPEKIRLILAAANEQHRAKLAGMKKEASNVESPNSSITFWNQPQWGSDAEAHALELAQPPPFLLEKPLLRASRPPRCQRRTSGLRRRRGSRATEERSWLRQVARLTERRLAVWRAVRAEIDREAVGGGMR